LSYGFIFDSPTGTVTALIPEMGLLLGKNRWIGRTLIGISKEPGRLGARTFDESRPPSLPT